MSGFVRNRASVRPATGGKTFELVLTNGDKKERAIAAKIRKMLNEEL